MSLFLHSSDSNSIIQNLKLQGGTYSGAMIVSSGKETLKNLEIRRCHLQNVAPNVAKWGMLLYNQENNIHRGLTIEGIWKEHGCYTHSPRYNLTFIGCKIRDCGAQGLQVTWRSNETDDLLGFEKTGLHSLTNCEFDQCGQPRGYGRASFCISFFGRQGGGGSTPKGQWDSPVLLKDVAIRHDSALGLTPGYELRGALLVQHRPYLHVFGGETRYRGLSDRSLWKIFQTKDVVVDGHKFEGQRYVDICGAQSVKFTNCQGNVEVKIVKAWGDKPLFKGPVNQGVNWHI